VVKEEISAEQQITAEITHDVVKEELDQ